MAAKKTTINDIATAAGVSKTTVSRYINGRYDLLSDSARKRVEKAIQLAHYRPSAVARSLKTQRSYLVGVIVANITTPFATSLLNGISSGLREGGYVPIFADAGDSPDTEQTLVESLISHQVDGLIVNTTTSDNPNLISLANTGTPVVLCDRYVNDYNFDIAVCPYREPTVELMEHLHGEGFGRCVLLTQEYENNSPRLARYEAFVETDKKLFGATDGSRDTYVVDPWRPATVAQGVAQLLADTPEGVPVGVYATNTVTLIAIFNALVELGFDEHGMVHAADGHEVRVGLCGPDDWGWAHQMGWDWPSSLCGGVTTFETNPYAMGYEAARLMIERIADPMGKKQTRLIPTQLRVRRSTQLREQRVG